MVTLSLNTEISQVNLYKIWCRPYTTVEPQYICLDSILLGMSIKYYVEVDNMSENAILHRQYGTHLSWEDTVRVGVDCINYINLDIVVGNFKSVCIVSYVDHTISGQGTALSTLDHSATTPRATCLYCIKQLNSNWG